MSNKFLKMLIKRYPKLAGTLDSIDDAFNIFKESYENDGIIYVCGNGGSAADAEHIVGELLKEFVVKRGPDADLSRKLIDRFGDEGMAIADGLQRGLRAVALNSHLSFSTAFANDVDGTLVFAQQLSVLARKNDVLLGITTSGNSENVVKCLQVAVSMGLKTVAMTGKDGGRCAGLADCCIMVPETETFIIQEYHLPIYHTLCLMLESFFYEKR